MMATILLAEANPILRDASCEYLSAHAFQVETAEDGLECLAELRRVMPDLLILDEALLWGGGDGVLAVMREDPRLQHIPVILTCAGKPRAELPRLVVPPVVQVLAKPFSLATLVEAAARAFDEEELHFFRAAPRTGVLVVDDDVAIRTLLQIHLQAQGLQVWTACNGEEALELCSEHGPEIAVALLDVQMPILDGPQTLEAMHAFDPEIRVCFMTGDPGQYDTNELLQMGAQHLFAKPFALDEITEVVQRLTGEPVGELLER